LQQTCLSEQNEPGYLHIACPYTCKKKIRTHVQYLQVGRIYNKKAPFVQGKSHTQNGCFCNMLKKDYLPIPVTGSGEARLKQ